MSEQERPLRLLSLDGGGIRGLSSLYILRNLLVAVQKQNREEPVIAGEIASSRPCDYFDLIAGTSTGGLIAIMLGLLRMDIQTCIDTYLSMAPEIFPTEGLVSRSILGRATTAVRGVQRFDPAPFEAAIKRLVKVHLGDGATGDEMMRSRGNQGCKVFVCVTSEKPRNHFRFRTYESPTGTYEDMAIWQACRATSAAPIYFPPISMGNPPRTFVDGGLGYNNPTQVLRQEATHIWPSRSIGCIISIGTGEFGSRDVGRSIKPLFETLKAISTDTEKVAREVKEEMEHQFPEQQVYFRFNVQQGLETVGLEEWKEMGRIQTATEAYLQDNWRQMKACASRILSPTHPISLGPVLKTMKSFSTVPFEKDLNFVGREDILAQLESEFADSKSQRWASLYGLGGIGKSQIAIEYSYRQQKRSSQMSTFWVHASSKARFEQSYAEIATKVEVSGTGDGKVDILQLVSRWLANPDNGPWLVILDNADDAAVLLDLSTSDTEHGAASMQRCLLGFLPRVQHGAVLITTRDRTCALSLNGHRGTPIEVLSMSSNDSVKMLRNVLSDALEEEAADLVKELEYVPLAISQASAYIKVVSQISIHRYLEIFRRSNEDQAALLNKDKGDLRRDRGVANAVITSWELSFDQIRNKTPRSAQLLSLMCYLNRQAIPQFLIQGDADEISFAENMEPLLSFSLIRAEIGGDTFEMHRLVQIAMQHWLLSEGREQVWKERAIERVAHHFPWIDQDQDWPVCEALMSHADEMILHEASSKESQLNLAKILVSTARYLVERKGHAKLAEDRSADALQIWRQYFDEDSDEILVASSVLATAQSHLFKHNDATRLQEDILKQRLKKRGPEDRETLIAMHNLACSCDSLGQFERSEELLQRVIESQERLLGSEDPLSLASKNLLAQTQIALGKDEEAEKLSSQLLEINTRCLGREHITTLHSMQLLFLAYTRQSKFKDAENMLAGVIPLFTKVFGPSHSRTLEARRSLGNVYYRQGKLGEAEEICVSCLDTAQETYGPQNPTTLPPMNLLALIYQKQRRFVDASRIFKDVLESRKQVSGADHPDTLTSLNNLALCCYDMGDKDHAIQLMTEVLRERRKILPADHPYTAASARVLARWKSEEEESEEWETEEEGSEEEVSKERDAEIEESEETESEETESEETESEEEENEDVDYVREQLVKVQISAPVISEAGSEVSQGEHSSGDS